MEPRAPAKRWLRFALRLTVTAAAIGVVLWRVELETIVNELRRLRPAPLTAAVALLAFGLGIRALRWRALLTGMRNKVPAYFPLLHAYVVGHFFNAFLPTGLGGDVARVSLTRGLGGGRVALAAVLVDRLCGVVGMFALALGALPLLAGDVPPLWLGSVAGVAATGMAVGLGVLAAAGPLERILGRAPALAWLHRSGEPALVAVARCPAGAIAMALMWSVVVNALVVIAWWLAAGALGYSVAFAYVFAVVPVLNMALLVPSLGGFGVLEASAPTMFAAAGLSLTQATALAVTAFAINRAVGLLGAPALLLRPGNAAASGEQSP